MSNNKDRNLVDMNTGILPTEDEIYAQADKAAISITASGSSLKSVTVTSYDVGTNIGQGTIITGAPISYTNATGSYLVAGDVVAVATDTAGNNVAVALISRAGSISPGSLVPIYPDTNYPIRVDNLPFTMSQAGSFPQDSYNIAYDAIGSLGQGTDSIIGIRVNEGFGGPETYYTINGINVNTRNSFSFGDYKSAATVFAPGYLYVQPSGYIFESLNGTIYVRNLLGIYSSIASVTSHAFDRTNGTLFYRTGTSLYAWFNGNSSATLLSTTYNTITLLRADNGYVAGTIGGNLYSKLSSDTSDWALVFSGASTVKAVGPDGALYTNSTSSGFHTVIRYKKTNVSKIIVTNIATATSTFAQILITAGGVTVFTLKQRADILIPGSTATSYGIGLFQVLWDAIYPAANTALMVADSSMIGNTGSANSSTVGTSSLQQKTPTSIMWLQNAYVGAAWITKVEGYNF